MSNQEEAEFVLRVLLRRDFPSSAKRGLAWSQSRGSLQPSQSRCS